MSEVALTPAFAESSPRVLVVDDEASVRLGCVMSLRADGWQVEGEGSPRRALERLASGDEHHDVLVLDYAMADIDGLAFASALDPQTRPSILLASAHATGAVALEALRLGIWDFQVKPLIPEEFRRRVRRLYDRPQDPSRIARALEHCRHCAWADALAELREAQGERPSQRVDLLIGLVCQVAGDESGAREAFSRAHWWPEWHRHDVEIWTELARRLG